MSELPNPGMLAGAVAAAHMAQPDEDVPTTLVRIAAGATLGAIGWGLAELSFREMIRQEQAEERQEWCK